LRILGTHAAARDALRGLGLQDRFGHMGRSATASDVVEEFQREDKPVTDTVNLPR